MSNNNNNAPFYVGQRVVCLESATTISKKFRVQKDITYTVAKCSFLFGVPIVQLIETSDANWDPERFAPIEPRHQDVEIAEEILEGAKELVEKAPEKSDKPVPKPAVAN